MASRSGRNSPMPAEGVRVLTIDECERAAETLAHAFKMDHVVRYPIDTPDAAEISDEEKWRVHVRILEYLVSAHIYNGLATTVGPNYESVALWCPPGKNVDDWITVLRSGLWRLRFKLTPEGRHRFFDEFLPLLHDTKHDILGKRDRDSYYLVYIGTKPEEANKGYARALIEDITRKADQENRACYLESSSAVNVPMYTRRGFTVRKRIYLNRADEPVPMDIMVREPVNDGLLRPASTSSSSSRNTVSPHRKRHSLSPHRANRMALKRAPPVA